MTTHVPDPKSGIPALALYFATSEADHGLRSSWGPLADIALGGFSPSPDPERMVSDHRFTLGRVPSALSRARVIRGVLMAMDPILASALFVAHGPTLWDRTIVRAFGRKEAARVKKRLGELAPVALLTPEVRDGWAAAAPTTEPSAQAQWNTPGGWLVAMCGSADVADKATVARVKASASRLLAGAEATYLDRMGERRQEAGREREAVRRRRERATRPLSATAGVGLQ